MKYNVHKRNYFVVSAVCCIPVLLYWIFSVADMFVPGVDWILDDFSNVYDMLFHDEAMMMPSFCGLPILVITALIYLMYYRKEIPVWTSFSIMFSSYLGIAGVAFVIRNRIWDIFREDQVLFETPVRVYFWRAVLLLILLFMIAVLARLIISIVKYPKPINGSLPAKYRILDGIGFYILSAVSVVSLLYGAILSLYYSVPCVHKFMYSLHIEKYFTEMYIDIPFMFFFPVVFGISLIFIFLYREKIPVWVSVGIGFSGYGVYSFGGAAVRRMEEVLGDSQSASVVPLEVYFERAFLILLALAMLSVLVRLIISMVRYPKNLSKGENNEI